RRPAPAGHRDGGQHVGPRLTRPQDPTPGAPAPTTERQIPMEALYTAEALSTGAGRTGRVVTADGTLDLTMAPPQEMGGSGDGANPEQLFAAGYAACFHSALQGVARQRKVSVQDSSVGGRVQIGSNGEGGFQL